jgi:two-component system response regulator DesR
MKVLIVEDNPEMRRLLRGLVARLAEAVYECADGDEALDCYVGRQLGGGDWVLMDIEMPRMDGLAATRQLLAAHPDARVCIVTSYDQPEFRAEAQAAGASGFVVKEKLHEVRRLLQSN